MTDKQKRIKYSRVDMANLFGVTDVTIYNWTNSLLTEEEREKYLEREYGGLTFRWLYDADVVPLLRERIAERRLLKERR